MKETEELKPCPFCGSKVNISEIQPDYGIYIRCENKKCILQEIELNMMSEDRAIEAWNKRA